MKQNLYLILSMSVFFFSPLKSVSHANTNSEQLYAAFTALDVTPPKGVPLAGFGGGNRRLFPWDVFDKYPYATFLKPSKGKLDPIRAKVLVLKRGSKKLLFLGLDVVAYTKDNRDDIMKLLKHLDFKDEEVFISATHTHSGPGTLSKNFVWQVLAADQFNSKIYNQLKDQIFMAVNLAMMNLEPAELFQTKFEADGLQKNRRTPDGAIDKEVQMLVVKSQDNGAILGSLFNFAMHGTALKTENLLFSSDINGAMERSLESALHTLNSQSGRTTQHSPIAIHINGAEGDITPINGGKDGMDDISQRFVAQALPALETAMPIASDWSVARKEVKLISPGLNLKACTDQKTVRALIWKKLRLKLGLWFPKNAQLYSLKLGPVYMMSWPGEPTSALGLALKAEAKAAGLSEPWVMGLTNDYLAYWTTKSEYKKAAYEACNTLYGENGGSTIIATHKELFDKHSK
jgi:neutral ceramidase